MVCVGLSTSGPSHPWLKPVLLLYSLQIAQNLLLASFMPGDGKQGARDIVQDILFTVLILLLHWHWFGIIKAHIIFWCSVCSLWFPGESSAGFHKPQNLATRRFALQRPWHGRCDSNLMVLQGILRNRAPISNGGTASPLSGLNIYTTNNCLLMLTQKNLQYSTFRDLYQTFVKLRMRFLIMTRYKISSISCTNFLVWLYFLLFSIVWVL